jgi:hypothetical protein
MGSAFTTLGGDPVPAPEDQVAIPADILLYAEAIGHKIVHWVDDQAERDSVYAAAVAPVWVACPTALWLKISGSGGSSIWKTVWSDSGPVTTGLVAGTDFQYASGYVRKINNLVTFSISVVRKNSSITAAAYNSGSPGNITSDPVCVTLPVDFRPDRDYECTWRGNTNDGVAEVNSGGGIELISGTPSGVIAIDDTVIVSGTFPVP